MLAVDDYLGRLSDEARSKLRRQTMPSWVAPMLAVLSKEPFSHPEWVYEAKLDGQRSLLFKKGTSVRLMTRNQKDRTSHYPDLVEAIERSGMPDLIADGEIVAFEGERTSFSRLQDRMQNSRPSPSDLQRFPISYYLFDLIWIDGFDLASLSLLARKEVLRTAFDFVEPLRFSEHLEEDGEEAFAAACAKGWEGLIAKRSGAPYTQGRSRDWRKFKCVNEQGFVVVGWTDPQGARPGLGALLVAYNEDGALRFAGKVGTGFNDRELERLIGLLKPLERSYSPLIEAKGLPKKGIHWVAPMLVAQVGFGEWTDEGKLRHPRYLGLRDDKTPDQIVRESG